MINGKIVQAPCKDCPDRAVGCHGTCEKYAEYKEACKMQKQTLLKDKAMDYFTFRTYKALKILQKTGRAPKC